MRNRRQFNRTKGELRNPSITSGYAVAIRKIINIAQQQGDVKIYSKEEITENMQKQRKYHSFLHT